MYEGLNYPMIGNCYTPISIFIGGVFLVCVVLDTLFVYEQSISYRSSSIYSRAHSRIECLKYIILTLVCFSYFFISKRKELFSQFYSSHYHMCILRDFDELLLCLLLTVLQ